MAKDFDSMEDSNRSANTDIHQVSDPAKRISLQWLAGLSLLAHMGAGKAQNASSSSSSRLNFQALSPSLEDFVQVPPGYRFNILAAWGEPVGIPGNMPAYRADASNTAAEQAAQMGMHHDGLVFFPLNGSSIHGVIMTNHEYTDDGLLHSDGIENWTAEKVKKSQNAHGLSAYEPSSRTKVGRWCGLRVMPGASPWTQNLPSADRQPGIF